MRVRSAVLAVGLAHPLATTFSQDLTAFWMTPWGVLLRVVIIIVVGVIVRLVARAIIRVFVNRVVTGAKRRQGAVDTQALIASPVTAARVIQRTRTLGSVLNNIVSVLVVVVCLLLIVTTINPDITGAFSLITAALGAGLGFGAQNIVKDVLTGLFMVADDQLGVGDVVDTGLATGVVEGVGIRVTQIRDVNGVLWFVRNGEITRVGNFSQGWSRAIIDVSVPHDTDIDTVQHRMLAVAVDLTEDPQWAASVLEKPAVWGLESITPDAIVLRLVVKTRSAIRDDLSWALRVHMKDALDEMGVATPGLTSPILEAYESAGPLRGLRPPRTEPTTTIKAPTPRKRTPRA